MSTRWFEVELTVTLCRVTVSLGTPDFTIENPGMRPGWWPKWQFIDFTGHNVEVRRSFMFSWFFHFSAAWGFDHYRDPEECHGEDQEVEEEG